MTDDQIKTRLTAACDYGCNHPHIVGADNVKLLEALREYFNTRPAAVTELAQVYNKQNGR